MLGRLPEPALLDALRRLRQRDVSQCDTIAGLLDVGSVFLRARPARADKEVVFLERSANCRVLHLIKLQVCKS